MQHGGGGHDPAAAETAGQRQRQGGDCFTTWRSERMLVFDSVLTDLHLSGECWTHGLCQGISRGEECQKVPRQPGQTAQGDL